MDFTLMIIAKSSEAMTSQLKSYPTREYAEIVADKILEQATKSTNRIEVLKLYV